MQERVVAHRVLVPLTEIVLRTARSRRTAPVVPGPVRFLVLSVQAKGGSVRSNLQLAGFLSQHHPVEVLSMFQVEENSFFALPSGVAYRVLDDRRPDAPRSRLQRVLSRRRSVLMHPHDRAASLYSLWTDLQLMRALRRLDGGWLITTRSALTVFAARFAPPGVVVVARDHDNFTHSSAALHEDLRRLGDDLDALSVLSSGDERDYTELLAGSGVRVFRLPNALVPLDGEPAPVREKVVLAAGRLMPQKGFDLLIPAFAPVAARHPEWQLHIYGDGREQAALQRIVDGHGLGGNVSLLPATRHIGEKMTHASPASEHLIREQREALPVQHAVDRDLRDPPRAVVRRRPQQITLPRRQPQRHRSTPATHQVSRMIMKWRWRHAAKDTSHLGVT